MKSGIAVETMYNDNMPLNRRFPTRYLSSRLSVLGFLSTNFFSVPYTGQMSRWSSNELSDLQTTRNLQYGHSLMSYEQSVEQSGSLSLSSRALVAPLAICIEWNSRSSLTSFSKLATREVLELEAGDELPSCDSCSENFRIRNRGTWLTSITFRFAVELLMLGEWVALCGGDFMIRSDLVSPLGDLATKPLSIGSIFSSLRLRFERRDRSGK